MFVLFLGFVSWLLLLFRLVFVPWLVVVGWRLGIRSRCCVALGRCVGCLGLRRCLAWWWFGCASGFGPGFWGFGPGAPALFLCGSAAVHSAKRFTKAAAYASFGLTSGLIQQSGDRAHPHRLQPLSASDRGSPEPQRSSAPPAPPRATYPAV